MKCPFRVNENEEFKECYGSECMAYFEYEIPFTPVTYRGEQISSTGAEKQTMTGCKQMTIFAPAPNYCV